MPANTGDLSLVRIVPDLMRLNDDRLANTSGPG